METLAALEPSPFPVISLYLSLSTNQNGREDHQQFVRKVFSERAKALPARVARARELRQGRRAHPANTSRRRTAVAGQALAIFACSGSGSVRGHSARRADRRASLFIGSVAASVSARAAGRELSALRGRDARHQQGAHLCLRRGSTERDETDRRREDPPHLEGRMVAGALSAPRRQLPHASHQGSRRDARQDGARRRASSTSWSPATRSAMPILREQLPKAARREDGRDRCRTKTARAAASSQRTMAALREKDAETDVEKVAGDDGRVAERRSGRRRAGSHAVGIPARSGRRADHHRLSRKR